MEIPKRSGEGRREHECRRKDAPPAFGGEIRRERPGGQDQFFSGSHGAFQFSEGLAMLRYMSMITFDGRESFAGSISAGSTVPLLHENQPTGRVNAGEVGSEIKSNGSKRLN
jgi:hypothetical protein